MQQHREGRRISKTLGEVVIPAAAAVELKMEKQSGDVTTAANWFDEDQSYAKNEAAIDQTVTFENYVWHWKDTKRRVCI